MSKFIQFGTSRLLQAHADLFISESLGANQICVVQTTGSPETMKRLKALASNDGYTVEIKGLREGSVVKERCQVFSIEKALSTAIQWTQVKDEILSCDYVLSNVSEKGYIASEYDKLPAFNNNMSFPTKLFLLLSHRFAKEGRPVTIMPLELFEYNGRKLRDLIIRIARRRHASGAMIDWLNECRWVNSLVDRIVSDPLDPAGAIAEPYALWAVEDVEGLEFPFQHHAVKIVPSLLKYQTLKLYILNLSHTYMAAKWANQKLAPGLTVREYLADQELMEDLVEFQTSEILPNLASAGMETQAKEYITETLDRFKNPFLNHKLSDIYDGHAQKVQSRAIGFLKWAAKCGEFTPQPRLLELIQTSLEVST